MSSKPLPVPTLPNADTETLCWGLKVIAALVLIAATATRHRVVTTDIDHEIEMADHFARQFFEVK